jgi:phosphoribosyl-ATP pyrophosphohydrolase/phosphoribosyl-AMP cyclohydrolase
MKDRLEPRWNEQGLAPTIVQDTDWRGVDAGVDERRCVAAHTRHGPGSLWSRSRQSLWHKGDFGERLSVVEIRLDCDEDAILLRVEPAGPACHTGEHSCFFQFVSGHRSTVGDPPSNVMRQLYHVILDRKQNPQPDSYTAQLFERGLAEISKKLGEESVEVIVAALGQPDERLVSETADLLYHSLVLLAARNVSLEQVERELERRRK